MGIVRSGVRSLTKPCRGRANERHRAVELRFARAPDGRRWADAQRLFRANGNDSPSMNHGDHSEAVRGQEALPARRPNGARVARSLGLAGAARRPTLVRADTVRAKLARLPPTRDFRYAAHISNHSGCGSTRAPLNVCFRDTAAGRFWPLTDRQNSTEAV